MSYIILYYIILYYIILYYIILYYIILYYIILYLRCVKSQKGKDLNNNIFSSFDGFLFLFVQLQELVAFVGRYESPYLT